MPKRLLRLPKHMLAALSFALAAVVMLGIAFLAALIIESRTVTAVTARLDETGANWVTVEADGLQVLLSGTAPTEADRFRALNLVGGLVDSSRIRDMLDVAPSEGITAPRFSVEMLRNDDGIQLIGLVPETPAEGGLTAAGLVEGAAALIPGGDPADMLQTAGYPAPPTWDAALRFGLTALELLQRSKISVAADRVEITAISDSEADRKRFEATLRRARPEGVDLVMDISAPRPVITPFTLRFISDAAGARFDACSADTEKARMAILAAGAEAGVEGAVACTVGMGAPSPRWAEAVRAAIRAVTAMGAGSATFSDTDLTLTAGDGVTQAAFDRAVGDLRAALPDAFSLEAVPPRPDTASQGPAEFTATLAADGRVELRGRLVDEAQQAVVDAFARAEFSSEAVYVATRLDPELPDGWPIRVMAGLEALAQLAEGSLLVRADLVEVKGVTGAQSARGKITQILSSRLGQGQTFRVEVRYDEKLDPEAALPTPEECAAGVMGVLAGGKITFTPGSAEIAGDSAPLIGKLAEVLQDCPGVRMEIAGFTDSQGSDAGNQALSQARAEAVLIALQGRRVDVSGMVAVGYGEADPIADNGTEEGREANRRIEFSLIGAEPADDGEAVPNATAAAATEPGDAATVAPPPANPVIAETATGDAATADAAAVAATGDESEPGAAAIPEAPAAGTDPGAMAAGEATAAEPPAAGPDFSNDLSPSVAPTEKTIRPRARPETRG